MKIKMPIELETYQSNINAKIVEIHKMVKEMHDIVHSVDAEPIRHGYWLYDRLCSTNGGTYGVQRCSNCGYYYKDFGDEWNYCPHCGALMDEVKE